MAKLIYPSFCLIFVGTFLGACGVPSVSPETILEPGRCTSDSLWNNEDTGEQSMATVPQGWGDGEIGLDSNPLNEMICPEEENPGNRDPLEDTQNPLDIQQSTIALVGTNLNQEVEAIDGELVVFPNPEASRKLGMYFVDGTSQGPEDGTVVYQLFDQHRENENIAVSRYFQGVGKLSGVVNCDGICSKYFLRLLSLMCDDIKSGRVESVAVVGYSRGAILGNAAAQAANYACPGVPTANRYVWGGLIDAVTKGMTEPEVWIPGYRVHVDGAVVDHFYKDPQWDYVAFNTKRVERLDSVQSVVREHPVRAELYRRDTGGVVSVSHGGMGNSMVSNDDDTPTGMLQALQILGDERLASVLNLHFLSPNSAFADFACMNGVYATTGLVAGQTKSEFFAGKKWWRHTTAIGTNAFQGTCGGAGTNERAFFYRAEMAGTYTFSTAEAGTNIDTVLYIRSSCGGEELACNDNAEGLGIASVVKVQLTAGQEIMVFVDAKNGQVGNYSLRITHEAS